MKIYYDNKKIEKMLTNENKLVKKFGQSISDIIFLRIQYLRNADNLNSVSPFRPYRRHKLLGNYKNHFAIDITECLRLVIKPINEEEIDLQKIKDVCIVDIENYHN